MRLQQLYCTLYTSTWIDRRCPYRAAICIGVLLHWSPISIAISSRAISPHSQSSSSQRSNRAATWINGGRFVLPSIDEVRKDTASSSRAELWRTIHCTHSKWLCCKVSKTWIVSSMRFDKFDLFYGPFTPVLSAYCFLLSTNHNPKTMEKKQERFS